MLWKRGEGCLFPTVVYSKTVKGDGDFGNQKGVAEIRCRQVAEIRLPKSLKMSDNFSKVAEIRADTKGSQNEPKHNQNSTHFPKLSSFCN
jgi:hypothetical protein